MYISCLNYVSTVWETIIVGFIGGILGGFIAKNTAVFVKDQDIKRQIANLYADVDDFKDRYTIKYNAFARSTKNAISGFEDAPPEGDIPDDIPPELVGLAQSFNVDIAKALSGDVDELKKIQALLNQQQQGGKIQGAL